MLNTDQIKSILPQDYPFLMIDRVVDCQKGKSLTAIKNISFNEWPFFAQDCVLDNFPNTLLMEAAAQAALVLYHVSMVEGTNARPQYLLGRLKAEFVNPVKVGDQISIKIIAGKIMARGAICDVEILVEDEIKVKVHLILGVKQ